MKKTWLLGAAVAWACAAPTPVAVSPTAATPAPTIAPASPPIAELWLTKLDRDNALVGKIWDVKARAFVDESAAEQQLTQARFVLLGERHDNPDHHRLQARVIAALARSGRRPAVAFEMLEVEQQPTVDAYVAGTGATAAGFGAALGWEKTSWPPFTEYQPIFEAAFASQLKVLAGNVAQSDARALVKQGTAALPAERVQQLRLDQPFPDALQASLVDELRASHCGQLPEELLGPMALAQHARDAQMALVLARGNDPRGAVLISGGGHARKDRGVPYYLGLEMPNAVSASVSFREVQHDNADAESYATDEGPFDFVWFTPRGSDDDPCAAFAHPKSSRRHHEGPSAASFGSHTASFGRTPGLGALNNWLNAASIAW